MDRAKKQVKSGSDDIKKSLFQIGVGLAGATVAVGVFVRAAGKFEQSTIAFETMLGSAEEGKRVLSELAEFAARTPFTLDGIESSAKQLLAMGIETQKLMPSLKALGDVSAGLSVPIARLALNFGQVKTQGRLTGRELRDFAIAGVPLTAELAKQLKVSKGEVAKLVSAGKIGFPEVEKAFISMTSEGGKFANLMDKQARSLFGIWSNMIDRLQLMARAIGAKVLPKVKKMVSSTLKWVEANQAMIESGIGTFLENMVETATFMVFAIKNIIDAIRGFSVIVGGLNNLLKITMTIMAVLAGATLLIGFGKLIIGFVKMTQAVKAFGSAAFVANLKAIALPLAVGAAFVGLGLIMEDIFGFFTGKDSLIGAFFRSIDDMVNTLTEKFPILGTIVKGILVAITTPLNMVLSGVRALSSALGALASGNFSLAGEALSQGLSDIGAPLTKLFEGKTFSLAEAVGFGERSTLPTGGLTDRSQKELAGGSTSNSSINAPVTITVPEGTSPELVGSKVKEGIAEAMNRNLRETRRATQPRVAF